MTYAKGLVATGQSADALMEHLMTASDIDITTTANWITFPTGTNAKNAQVFCPLAGKFLVSGGTAVSALSFIGYLSGNPTSFLKLLNSDGAQDTANYFCGIDTNGKVCVTDGAGNIKLRSATSISTSSLSPTQVTVFWDFITLSTVWVSIFIAGVQDAAANTGQTVGTYLNGVVFGSTGCYFGHYQPAGSNTGATLTARNITISQSGTAGDAPHLAQFPQDLQGGSRLTPTGNGDVNAWTNGTGTGFTEVDEAPNDGDTTTVKDIQNNPTTAHDTLFTHSTANPIPAGASIWDAQLKGVGKLASAGKLFCDGLIKEGGTSITTAQMVLPGTAYQGFGTRFINAPSGSAWASTDFDLSGGVTKIQFGGRTYTGSAQVGAIVTMWNGVMPIWYTASLPLASTPRDPLKVTMLRQSVNVTQPARKPQVYGQWIGMFPAPVVASVTPTLRSWVTIT